MLVPATLTVAPATGAAVSASHTKPVTFWVTAGFGESLPPPPPQPARTRPVAAPRITRGASEKRDIDYAFPFSCVVGRFTRRNVNCQISLQQIGRSPQFLEVRTSDLRRKKHLPL